MGDVVPNVFHEVLWYSLDEKGIISGSIAKMVNFLRPFKISLRGIKVQRDVFWIYS